MTDNSLRQTLPITLMMDKIKFVFIQRLSLVLSVVNMCLSNAGLMAPTGFSISIL